MMTETTQTAALVVEYYEPRDLLTDKNVRLDQYDENTHRTGLTTRETAGLVQDLLDLGVTDAQLRRKTGLSKEQVTAAKTAAKSESALEFADTWQSLTLEQTAVIAEFEDDQEALALLADASGRGQVDHVAQQLRDSAEERAQKKQLLEELGAAGVTILDSPLHSNLLWYWLDQGGEQLTAENHADCPGHVAWLSQQPVRVAVGVPLGSGFGDAGADSDGDEEDEAAEPEMVWRQEWAAKYACTDPAGNGHKDRYGRDGGAKKATTTEEEKEAASAERRKVLAGNKAWRAAEKVRRRWLKEFLTRTTPPDGSLRITLRALVGEHHEVLNAMQNGHHLAAEFLGLTDQSYGVSRDYLATLIDGVSDGRAQVIALGLVLAAYEEHLGVEAWRHADRYPGHTTVASRYLNLLAEWGYGLSDLESKVAAAVVEKTS